MGTVSHDAASSPGDDEIKQSNFMAGENGTKIRLKAHRKRILLPKQTHPGCSSRSFKSYLGAAPPLERGASFTFFKGLEEAG
jgi:hypothetical protein